MKREEFLALAPELVNNYHSSADAHKRIGGIGLLMVIGPSGAGKTTIINRVGLPYVPSDTTRPQRPEELNGKDYHFRQDYEGLMADITIGNFVQVAIGSGGDFYATRDSSYPEDGIAVMAVMADVIPIFRDLGFKETISAFIVPPSFEEWHRRLDTHKLSPEQLRKRLAESERSLNFALTDSDTHMILNDDIEAATKQLKDLAEGKSNVKREEEAKTAANNLLNRLKLSNT